MSGAVIPDILHAMMSRKFAILAALYFVQGLPYGFQVTALPVYLRESGMSLSGIGLASLLAVPWSLKIIWGPWVDRFGSRRFGRRKTWIVPLQLGLASACAVAAWVEPSDDLQALLVLVLLMNIFAATLDVAVDGLAVDLLERRELGYGNIAQVVGFKLGMLTGGGVLIWLSGSLGWRGVFLSITALILAVMVITAFYREEVHGHVADIPPSVGDVLRALMAAMRLPGAWWLLLFIATYKFGESMADTMFRPFLVDSGFSAQQIGLWLGTWGLIFSLLGSVLGGLAASRLGLFWAVAGAASLRALAVGGEWWLSLVEPTAGKVIGVIIAEQLFGGALTTALFAFMMSRVDRRIGATHYTVLATVEVTGKLVASWISGYLATGLGYSGLFGLSTVLAVVFLGLLYPIFIRGVRSSSEQTA